MMLDLIRMFKQAHGTEMAAFALKQTVDFYRNQDALVYMCFLDANEAFDREDHWTVTNKLLNRGVPLNIVKLFIVWYREKEFMVRGIFIISDISMLEGD